MAVVSQGAFVALNGIDLSGVLTSVNVSGQADLKDRTALGDTNTRKWQKALIERTVSGDGFFKASETTADDANGMFNAALASLVDSLMLFGDTGAANGAKAEMISLKSAKYDVENSVGELVTSAFEGNVEGNNYQVGVFIFNQTVTGETNGTSYDSTTGGTGYYIQIQVTAGDDAAVIAVQHSADNSIWVDLLSSNDYNQNEAFVFSSTATSVNRYVRVVANVNGTTNTVAVAIKVGYSG